MTLQGREVSGPDPWTMARESARECREPESAHPHTFALRWRDEEGSVRIRIFSCTRVRVICGHEGRQSEKGCGLAWTLPYVEHDPVALQPDPEGLHGACGRKPRA